MEFFSKLTYEDVRRAVAKRKLLEYNKYVWSGFEVNWHHELICQKVEDLIFGRMRKKNLMIFAPPRHGKALAYGTEVPTPSGFRLIESIQSGDYVIGSDGKPTKVVAVAHWKNRECYRVTTDDRHSVIVDGEHEWKVRLDRKHKAWSVRTTKHLAERTSPRNPMIGVSKFEGQHQELPIAPYTLGVWLGDGSSCDGGITQHPDDQPFLEQRLAEDGFRFRYGRNKFRVGVLGLTKLLRLNGLLQNKHIPEIYFSASVEQRMRLLQGLMDSDGDVAKDGQCSFSNMNKGLIDQVAQLVNSLGAKAFVIQSKATTNGKDCGLCYRVLFYMAGCATLPRKAERTKDGTRTPNRYITIEKVGNHDTCCIQVEAEDSLYLCTRNYILTHNSQICTRSAPSYFLGHFPDENVICCSYGADLSYKMSRDTSGMMLTQDFAQLFPETKIGVKNSGELNRKAVFRRDEFEVAGRRGGYRATGVGGGITGMGFHFGIIDDPFKDAPQALSLSHRDKVWDWYVTAFATRKMPGAKTLLIMTRWHNDDLAGRLLEHEGDQWEVVCLPGVSRLDQKLHPNDPRAGKDGIPLWPNRFGTDFHNGQRHLMGPHWYAAMYDQEPIPLGAGLFNTDMVGRFWEDNERIHIDGYEYLKHTFDYGAAVDLACTEDHRGDYTAIVFFRVGPRNEFVVDEVCRERVSVERLPQWILGQCARHPNVRKIAVEADGFQKSAVREMRQLKGMPSILEMKTSSRSKMERAIPAVTRMANKQVFIPLREPEWWKMFKNELSLFTGDEDKHDDMVDAFSHGVSLFSLRRSGKVEGISSDPEVLARLGSYFSNSRQ